MSFTYRIQRYNFFAPILMLNIVSLSKQMVRIIAFNKMTLNNLYQYIINHLFDVFQINEAKTIAYLLLEHYTKQNKISVCLNPDVDIEDSVIEKIDKAIKELQNHKPIQYVLGETTFCDLPFLVNKSVLIPRPETEELVSLILEDGKESSKILDICTGSGCIAVALAHSLKKSQVYGVDISEEAIETARKNATLNQVDIHFLQKDIFSSDFEKEINHQFDVIVSNPPYVREGEKQYMHRRVLNFEPALALFVEDNNPLLFYHQILKIGQSLLNDNGKIYIEINEAFGEEMISLLTEYGYNDIRLYKDIHGKDRMLTGGKGCLKP